MSDRQGAIPPVTTSDCCVVRMNRTDSQFFTINAVPNRMFGHPSVQEKAARILVLASFDTTEGAQNSDQNLEKLGRKLCSISGGGASIDLCDGYSSTPTVTEMESYDAVVVAGTQRFENRVALGDALDDYLDLGGGVLLLPFIMSDDGGGGSLGGRLPFAPDFPVSHGPDDDSGTFGSVPRHVPKHPVLMGVDPFMTAEGNELRRCGRHLTELRGGATALASYDDGTPLVALPTTMVHPGRGRIAYLNLEPEDAIRCGLRLLWNSISWVQRSLAKDLSTGGGDKQDKTKTGGDKSGKRQADTGWLLDGYPQTQDQAWALEAAGVRPDMILAVMTPLPALLGEHANRWFDPFAKRTYDLKTQSRNKLDPAVNARLVQRQKDTPEAVKRRVQEFQDKLQGLREAYGAAVVEVDGSLAVPPSMALSGLEPLFERPNAKVAVIGMAGSGKGRLCEEIQSLYPHCRYHNAAGAVHAAVHTSSVPHGVPYGGGVGKRVREYTERGKAIPDSLMVSLLASRLGGGKATQAAGGVAGLISPPIVKSSGGKVVRVQVRGVEWGRGSWILDGLPRDASQAEMLEDAGIRPDLLLIVEACDDSLMPPAFMAATYSMARERLARHLVTCSELRELYGSKGVLIATVEGAGPGGAAGANDRTQSMRGGANASTGARGGANGPSSSPAWSRSLSRLHRALSRPGIRVMVAGMAGSGKGRICEHIAQTHQLDYLSMSTVVHGAAGTPLGNEAVSRLKAKESIPDQVLIKLLTEQLGGEGATEDNDGTRGGQGSLNATTGAAGKLASPVSSTVPSSRWLLDGFPTNRAQVETLVKAYGLVPDCVLILPYTPPQKKDPKGEKEKAHKRLSSALREAFPTCVYEIQGIQDSNVPVAGQLPSRLDPPRGPGARVLVCGMAGSGKGRLCEYLCTEWKLEYINAAKVVHTAIKKGGEQGQIAKMALQEGRSVPADSMMDIVSKTLDLDASLPWSLGNKESKTKLDYKRGKGGRGPKGDTPDSIIQRWLLDGYPESKRQAQGLCHAGVTPRMVIICDVDLATMIESSVHNRYDPVTRKAYNMRTNPPTDPDLIGRLVQKGAETREAIRFKWEAFQYEYSRLLAFYTPHVPVYRIDARSQAPEEAARQAGIDFTPLTTPPTVSFRVPGQPLAPLPSSSGPVGCVVLGMARSGKGQFSTWLSERYGLRFVNSSIVIAGAIQQGDSLGKALDSSLGRKEGIKDELMVDLVSGYLGAEGLTPRSREKREAEEIAKRGGTSTAVGQSPQGLGSFHEPSGRPEEELISTSSSQIGYQGSGSHQGQTSFPKKRSSSYPNRDIRDQKGIRDQPSRKHAKANDDREMPRPPRLRYPPGTGVVLESISCSQAKLLVEAGLKVDLVLYVTKELDQVLKNIQKGIGATLLGLDKRVRKVRESHAMWETEAPLVAEAFAVPCHTVLDLESTDAEAILAQFDPILSKSGSRIVMVGPAGAGRGDLTERILDRYGHGMISIGTSMQDSLKEGLEYAIKAQKRLKSGKKLKDKTVVKFLCRSLQAYPLPACPSSGHHDDDDRDASRQRARGLDGSPSPQGTFLTEASPTGLKGSPTGGGSRFSPSSMASPYRDASVAILSEVEAQAMEIAYLEEQIAATKPHLTIDPHDEASINPDTGAIIGGAGTYDDTALETALTALAAGWESRSRSPPSRSPSRQQRGGGGCFPHRQRPTMILSMGLLALRFDPRRGSMLGTGAGGQA